MPLPQKGPLFILWICLISVMPCREEAARGTAVPVWLFGGIDTPETWVPSALSSHGGGNGCFEGSPKVPSTPGPFSLYVFEPFLVGLQEQPRVLNKLRHTRSDPQSVRPSARIRNSALITVPICGWLMIVGS